LRAEGRHRNFAGLAAVNDLTFQLEKDAIHGLIGPNGAGKTTILNVISGFYKPGAGRILFEGERYQHAHCTAMSEMGHEETLAPARSMSVLRRRSQRVDATLYLEWKDGVYADEAKIWSWF